LNSVETEEVRTIEVRSPPSLLIVIY